MRFLTCALLLLLTAASPKPGDRPQGLPRVEVTEAQLVGSWKASVAGIPDVTGTATLRADGRFTSTGASPGQAVSMQGRWFLRAGALVWVYDQMPGAEDVNPILEISQDDFKIQEMSGLVTTFTRVGRVRGARGAKPPLRKACAGEIGILCHEAGDDDTEVKDCLRANASKVLPACARALGPR